MIENGTTLYYFMSQFVMVGLLGLQSKLNRDHRVVPMGLNSLLISAIQIDVFVPEATVIGKLGFAFGGAIGIMFFTHIYERLNNERPKQENDHHTNTKN